MDLKKPNRMATNPPSHINVIPKELNIDPYDDPNLSTGKARLAGRYGASFKRRNKIRWANVGQYSVPLVFAQQQIR
jgi:hypothetical protein